MERTSRRTLTGVVTSDKMDKTIVVAINGKKNHPLYGKGTKFTRKFKVRDENNEAHVGDLVTIMETRRLSASKRFRLVSIDKKAEMSVKEAEAEIRAEEAAELAEAGAAPAEEEEESK